MHHYTILFDFRGGSYVEQLKAEDEAAALRSWVEVFGAAKRLGSRTHFIMERLRRKIDAGYGVPVLLQGAVSVWYSQVSYGGHIGSIHIVKTDVTS